jgi:hypothetical protein
MLPQSTIHDGGDRRPVLLERRRFRRPRAVETLDQIASGPFGLHEQAVQPARIAVPRVQRQVAEDEPELVVLLDEPKVDRARHDRAVLELAEVPEGIRVGARPDAQAGARSHRGT